MIRSQKLFWLALAICLAGVATTNAGQSPAVTSVTGGNLSGGFNQTTLFGFDFSPLVPIDITALGVFDTFGDGLTTDMTTGLLQRESQPIFPGSGAFAGIELARVVTPAGTGTDLEGSYRYVELSTPIRLEPGNTYQVTTAYFSSGSEGWRSGATLEYDSLLGDIDARAVQGNSLTDIRFVNSSYVAAPVGPNFLFRVVPEPSSLLTLLFIGSISLTCSRWENRSCKLRQD